MASRFVALLVAAAFVLALFAPAGVAAADDHAAAPAADAGHPQADSGDVFALELLHPALAGQSPSRGGAATVERDQAPRKADRESVLDQATRAAVYERVRASPGDTLAGIADAVDVTKSTVRYHVRVLREAGLVDATEAAGAMRVVPADADAELVASLNAPGTGPVLAAIAEHEPVSVTDLARATDRAPSTVSHHLSTLEERGLVERERAGEAVVTTLAPATRTAMTSGVTATADD